MIKKIKKEFLDIFGKDNGIILLLPTTVIHAPKLRNIYVTINKKNLKVRDLLLRNTIIFNSIGFPALTIPLTMYYNLSQSILPIGLQLVGAPRNDNLVFEAGMSIESLVAESSKPDN
jgi:aspartyl-tRNA(Asn)/glutamyl-tRNA(Gln) amidotransferase subunit A